MIPQPELFHAIVDLRRETEIRNEWLSERLRTVLPAVMRRAGIDTWIIVAHEYNEDPVLMSLLPAPMLSARRRTVLVFHAPADAEFRAMAIANAGIGLDGFYETVWDKSRTELSAESQEDCLRRVVSGLAPARIGINTSSTFAFADGLSVNEHQWLRAALGEELMDLTESAEEVAVGWLETRLPAELAACQTNNAIAHALIKEAFSSRVIQPGVTRASDVAWWLRERTRALGLSCWFQPSVSIQRQGESVGSMGTTPDEVIKPGDLLHCDYGLHYLGLATDTQQNAYVLQAHESEAPDGLNRLLATANRQQDLLAQQMVSGRTGNEILAAALRDMEQAGISGRIYSHPIGYHGHGAGPMIGRFDNQVSLPGTGDYPLHEHTMFSFEMYAEDSIADWNGETVRMATEQIASFTGGRIDFLGGRQTELHLI